MKTQIFFEVGETIHGQRIELVREKDDTYTIIQHAAGQRDETHRISGIKVETIRNMVDALDLKLKYNGSF
jgi:hypothetical protein